MKKIFAFLLAVLLLCSLFAGCGKQEDATYICHAECVDFWKDPADAGIYAEDKIREDIFIEDRIHFNQTGYDIYAEFLRKVLDDLL